MKTQSCVYNPKKGKEKGRKGKKREEKERKGRNEIIVPIN